MKRSFILLRLNRGAVAGLALAIAPLLLASCASHYDTALRDVALSPDRRLAERIDSMEERAGRALRALEAAAHAIDGRAARESRRATAHRDRLVNDAEAGAFEYSREVLSVLDVLGEPEGISPTDTAPLRESMLAAEDSLGAAVGALRGGASSLDDYLARARADVGAVSREAEAVRLAMRKAHLH